MRRYRRPTINGIRECVECGRPFPDTEEYYMVQRICDDGTKVLRADCRYCRAEYQRAYRRSIAEDNCAEATWTPPAPDAHWGYCSREKIWTHGNGTCHCGADWAQVVEPARMCEGVRG